MKKSDSARVTPETRFPSGNQTVTLQDLAQHHNQDVTLRFIGT